MKNKNWWKRDRSRRELAQRYGKVDWRCKTKDSGREIFSAVVLCRLIQSPEMVAKRIKRDCRLGRETIGLVRVKRALSANTLTL